MRLYKNKVSKSFTVHKLVASTYLGESLLQVNHRDGNKLNNTLSNLEYLTRADNMRHAHAKKKGVTKLPSGKYRACLWVKGENKHLGCFKRKKDAYEAYRLEYIKIYKVSPWRKE